MHHRIVSGRMPSYMSSATAAVTRPATERHATTAPAVTRVLSIDAFRGFVMFLMLAEAMQLWTLHDAFPGSRFWAHRRLQHDARAVAGLLAARPDPARLLVPRRRVAAVLDREPRGRGARRFGTMLGARRLAQRRADAARHLPALDRAAADVLDVRGHADADRPRLHVPVPARVRVAARAGRRVRRDPRRVLGGVRAVSAAPRRISTTRSVGVPADWPHLYTGFLAHFNKNSNLSWAFDVWFLNLFPRE